MASLALLISSRCLTRPSGWWLRGCWWRRGCPTQRDRDSPAEQSRLSRAATRPSNCSGALLNPPSRTRATIPSGTNPTPSLSSVPGGRDGMSRWSCAGSWYLGCRRCERAGTDDDDGSSGRQRRGHGADHGRQRSTGPAAKLCGRRRAAIPRSERLRRVHPPGPDHPRAVVPGHRVEQLVHRHLDRPGREHSQQRDQPADRRRKPRGRVRLLPKFGYRLAGNRSARVVEQPPEPQPAELCARSATPPIPTGAFSHASRCQGWVR